MIKAVVFDCFGVLAEDGWSSFKRKYLSDTSLAAQISGIGREVDSGLRSNDAMVRETARIVGIDESIVALAVNRKVPNEELFAFIAQSLKGTYKIGLLSNASFNVLEQLFTPTQVALFDATTLSYDTGMVKPEPGIYQVMCERLGVEPMECLVVDDQARHCEGAIAAGLQALQYVSLEQAIADIKTTLQQQ